MRQQQKMFRIIDSYYLNVFLYLLEIFIFFSKNGIYKGLYNKFTIFFFTEKFQQAGYTLYI